MVNFPIVLPDPQAPVVAAHAAAGSGLALLGLILLGWLVVLPAVLVFAPDVIMWVVTRWEARHDDQG